MLKVAKHESGSAVGAAVVVGTGVGQLSDMERTAVSHTSSEMQRPLVGQ